VNHAHHDHAHGPSPERRIGTAFFLNIAFTLLEIAGGFWTNSMAVLSDALHDLGDSVALALTWQFARISKRKGDEVFTFGYRRFSLLGALVMSIVLFAGGLVVVFESVPRIITPEPTNAPGMLALAIVGVLVNGIAALRMHGGRSIGERMAPKDDAMVLPGVVDTVGCREVHRPFQPVPCHRRAHPERMAGTNRMVRLWGWKFRARRPQSQAATPSVELKAGHETGIHKLNLIEHP
jgi:Co/Zn/Cd efflux system component